MRRSATLLVAGLAMAGAVAAAPRSTTDPAPPAPPRDPQAERFLAAVAPLLTDAERAVYVGLRRPYQRTAFEHRFWKERDPEPRTTANEFGDSWLERAPIALERWGSFDDARALVYAAIGEPSSTVELACPELLVPGEIWTVADLRLGGAVTLVFVSAGVTSRVEHRFWNPRDGVLALAASALSRARSIDEELLDRIAGSCPRGDEIASRLVVASEWERLVDAAGLLPRPNPEWLRAFTSLSTDLPAEAATMTGELDLRFPERRGLRTVVEGLIRLDEPPAANTSYQLDGEVVRDDELFESFRYRYQAGAGESVPLVFERPLRPGRYRLMVRLFDVVAERYYREELELDVPAVQRRRKLVAAAGGELPSAAPAPSEPSVAERVSAAAAALVARLQPDGDDSDPSIALHVPTDRLLLGKLRVEAVTRGPEVAEVAFALDGKQLLRKRREPFGVELDLGRSPRIHRLAAVAYDAEGVELASDEVLINGGPHRFAVRLVEPQAIAAGAERVTARAEVDVPEDERLDRVEFHVNDHHHATLFQPPWEQSLPLPPVDAGPAWIRVAAFLESGNSTEQVRMLGDAPGAEVDVDLVELHASVLDRLSRPVDDVGPDEFEVYEDGVRQELRRCELVRAVPIHAGVLLDTSGSMAEELEEAEAAASRFFESVLTERDRGAVITFAERPLLAARFTDKAEILASGLAGIEPTGNTRLWDSVAYALHYFSGIRGKRALILITDGDDSQSELAFEDVLEYARRTGVALYVIGFNVPQRPVEIGLRLLQLAQETGGSFFRVGRAFELEQIYGTIEKELRSQYLIAYQSTNDGDDYREIDIRIARRGHEARALRGYYP